MASSRGVVFGISPECLCHDVRDNVKRVAALEEAGFAELWEGDHTLPWQHSRGHNASVVVALEAFLQNTRRALVGGMVIPPIGLRRQPVDVALDFATMAHLHPGRVGLCVGTGEAMNEKTATGRWPSTRERVERVVEAIQLIRQCWSADDYFHFKGKYFDTFFYLYQKPQKPIPLYCAANGPVMAGNAGRYADGYVAVGVPPSYHREVLIPAFERGAREAGKDPAQMEKMAWVSTFYHPQREKALAAARMYGGVLIPECYHHIQDPRVIEERAHLIRDEALDAAFCIASSAEEIVATYGGFIEAGCNHIIWGDGSLDPSLVANLWAKEVLPSLVKARGLGPGPLSL